MTHLRNVSQIYLSEPLTASDSRWLSYKHCSLLT